MDFTGKCAVLFVFTNGLLGVINITGGQIRPYLGERQESIVLKGIVICGRSVLKL